MTSGNWVLTKALEGPGGAISELTNTASELVPKITAPSATSRKVRSKGGAACLWGCSFPDHS